MTEVKTVDELCKTSTSLVMTAPESTESSIRPLVGGAADMSEIASPLPVLAKKYSAFSFLTGIRNDLKARAPFYWDDWKVAPQDYVTVLNATVYTFMVQLIPALIFAELLDRQTEGKLAVAETLMSSRDHRHYLCRLCGPALGHYGSDRTCRHFAGHLLQVGARSF